MSTKQPTCEERVESHMESRIEDIRLLWGQIEQDDLSLVDDGTLDTVVECGGHEIRYSQETAADYREDDGTFHWNDFAIDNDIVQDFIEQMAEQRYEYGLAFDYVPAGTFTDQEQGFFRFQISWGGPSEEFRFYVDAERKCYRIEFWFLDWFDGADRTLHGRDREIMDMVYDEFFEMGAVDSELEKASE